jgi:predicted peptidase
VVSILILAAGLASAAETNTVVVQQAKRFEMRSPHRATVNYLLFLPRDYEKSQAHWPLLLYLHGSGESGTNLAWLKRNGPPKHVEKHPEFPFILVSPQHHFSNDWEPATLMALLDDIAARYRVDRRRIYLTGLSMGAGHTWMVAAAHPERFAAVVPVSGFDLADAKKLTGVPIWVFHGAKDSIVPVECSRKMVAAIRAAGGNVKYTEFPKSKHNIWAKTYENPELYEWLLKQRR